MRIIIQKSNATRKKIDYVSGTCEKRPVWCNNFLNFLALILLLYSLMGCTLNFFELGEHSA